MCVVVMKDRVSIANESNLNVCVYRFDCHRNYNLIDKSISNNDKDLSNSHGKYIYNRIDYSKQC